MEKHIGKTLKVLVETSMDGYSYGHTTNYLSVKIDGEYTSNDIVDVTIYGVEYPNVLGKIE